MTGVRGEGQDVNGVRERPADNSIGWALGDSKDYDREFWVGLDKLSAFLRHTQPVVAE